MKNPNEGFVGIAIGLLLGGERKEATLAHFLDVGELSVVVAEGERRDVLLVRLADGIVVVEIRVSVNDGVVESRAEQAGNLQFEKPSELVGGEGEKAVEEKHEDQNPFQHSEDDEVRDLS